jgi:putative ABC transport system permease protein
VAEGQFWTQSDVKAHRKVCVIGQTTAQNLFGDSAVPIGKNLRIQGINFQIVGLLALKGSAMFGDPDDQVVIPITTGMDQVFGVNYISNIYAQTARAEDATEASNEIEAALRKAHKLSPTQESDFSVRTQEEFMQIQDASSQTLTFLLTGIAAVALLVGGIGIMNIMLVSVTERTREIGIRKAIGAQENDILLQFLIEATTLSVLGGLLGIFGGAAVCYLVTTFLGFPTAIMPLWVGVSFLSSAAIGVFFGIYPAYKAARLDPIEALRYQ